MNKALEVNFNEIMYSESTTCQTPIARVLHKQVTGRLRERPAASSQITKAQAPKTGR